LFGNSHQLVVQAIGVGIALSMGFGGTFIILKVLDALIGIRVSPKVEDAGLDIEEHAERAYTEEEEFILRQDKRPKGDGDRDNNEDPHAS